MLSGAACIWLAACLTQYTVILGKAALHFVRYERIADRKQIAQLSRDARERGIPFYKSGYSYDLSYFKSAFSSGTALDGLKSNPMVYYLPLPPAPAVPDERYAHCDRIRIPYEPFPVYALMQPATSGTAYWQRACRVLDHALCLTPRHRQIEDALWAAWLFSGWDDLSSLSNRAALRPRRAAFSRGGAPVRPPWPPETWSVLDGWGHVETWDRSSRRYRWSNSHLSTLLLPLYQGKLRSLSLAVLPYYPPDQPGQTVTAWLGSHCLGSRTVAGDWQRIQFEVPVAVDSGERRLLLCYSSPASPQSLGRGTDNRTLALGLSVITPAFRRHIPGQRLQLGDDTAAAWLGPAWSHPEQWPDGRGYRWLEGTTGCISWIEREPLERGTWELQVLPYVTPNRVQRMTVLQDSTILTNLILVPGWHTYRIPVDPATNTAVGLQLIFNYARSPREEGRGNDPRRLSAAVSSISRSGPDGVE